MFTAAYSYTDSEGYTQDDVQDFTTIEQAVKFINDHSTRGAEIWQGRHRVELIIVNDQIVSYTL